MISRLYDTSDFHVESQDKMTYGSQVWEVLTKRGAEGRGGPLKAKRSWKKPERRGRKNSDKGPITGMGRRLLIGLITEDPPGGMINKSRNGGIIAV